MIPLMRTNACIDTSRVFGLLALVLLISSMSNSVTASTLYKWIDKDGKISYQDRPPPVGQAYEEKSFADKSPASESDADLNSEIKLPVDFYISNDCSTCDSVRTILEMNRVPYNQLLIDFNDKYQQRLIDIVGALIVPTVTIGGEPVTNLNRSSLESALSAGGHPEPRLTEH